MNFTASDDSYADRHSHLMNSGDLREEKGLEISRSEADVDGLKCT